MSATSEKIRKALAEFYTRHPYPRYPLMAKPLWQHGVTASPAYVWKVVHPDVPLPASSSVFIMGCGEVLPYIMQKWDRNSVIHAVDLSKKSIFRAKLRMGLTPKKVDFYVDDIDHFLSLKKNETYVHVDSYGVMHHLANPSLTLRETARVLKPGGTLRLMVYNKHARLWIRQFQKIFQLIKFSPYNKRSIDQATLIVRSSLFILGRRDWAFSLKPTFRSPTRFVDTFMHVREAQIDVKWWLSELEKNGLQIVSLLDRYGELDDLPNPFWCPPTPQEIIDRALDHRFENNLEIILKKIGDVERSGSSSGVIKRKHPKISKFVAKNSWWFSFRETVDLDKKQKVEIYQALLRYLNHEKIASEFWQRFPVAALQRLARIGAILPGMIADEELVKKLRAPMVSNMEAPEYDSFNEHQLDNILKMFAGELQKDPKKDKKMAIIKARLKLI